RAHQRFVISTHLNPEGDALGSQLALGRALETLGKDVRLCNRDPVPGLYRFLPGADRIEVVEMVPAPYDLLVLVDCGSLDRTGLRLPEPGGGEMVIVDHHLSSQGTGPWHWIDAGASATGEMIYALIRELAVPLDKTIAVNLYAAITTDTGTFRYSNTTPHVLRMAAELIERGADPWNNALRMYESHPEGRIRLLAAALGALERGLGGRAAWIILTSRMFAETGTAAGDTEGIVNYPRSIEGVEVAFLFRQVEEKEWKVSFRSKGGVNVASLAETFGGGGHHNAAGCQVSGTLEEVKQRVLQALERAFGESTVQSPMS
ncbi:MAG: bifunctional oligoribonuclease/PAP phosphatase NrnA, partial [Nitrospirae bacterium]|nr:bifunctional oligoribonuclease/PAP phosphatase NrnA [Nitrospirota bacterium]